MSHSEPAHTARARTTGRVTARQLQIVWSAAACCAVITTPALAACSSNNLPTPSGLAAVASQGMQAALHGAPVGGGSATLIVNGGDQHYQGTVTCQSIAGLTSIFLGPISANPGLAPPDGTGLVSIADAGTPTLVDLVVNVNGSVVIAGAGAGNSAVTKVDSKTYKVTGDSSTGNSFEFDATCR